MQNIVWNKEGTMRYSVSNLPAGLTMTSCVVGSEDYSAMNLETIEASWNKISPIIRIRRSMPL